MRSVIPAVKVTQPYVGLRAGHRHDRLVPMNLDARLLKGPVWKLDHRLCDQSEYIQGMYRQTVSF